MCVHARFFLRHGAVALLAAACVLPAGPAGAGPSALPVPTPEQRYQLGLEAQTMGDYGVMLAELRAAAEGGVVEARELLAMVLLLGPALYGDAVPSADRCESARWMRAAAADGSPVGRWQLHFLNRLRHAPGAPRHCPD